MLQCNLSHIPLESQWRQVFRRKFEFVLSPKNEVRNVRWPRVWWPSTGESAMELLIEKCYSCIGAVWWSAVFHPPQRRTRWSVHQPRPNGVLQKTEVTVAFYWYEMALIVKECMKDRNHAINEGKKSRSLTDLRIWEIFKRFRVHLAQIKLIVENTKR